MMKAYGGRLQDKKADLNSIRLSTSHYLKFIVFLIMEYLLGHPVVVLLR